MLQHQNNINSNYFAVITHKLRIMRTHTVGTTSRQVCAHARQVAAANFA